MFGSHSKNYVTGDSLRISKDSEALSVLPKERRLVKFGPVLEEENGGSIGNSNKKIWGNFDN